MLDELCMIVHKSGVVWIVGVGFNDVRTDLWVGKKL